MQGFLVGLILGAGAALGGLYYYGSFEVMDKEFGRSAGGDDYTMEDAVVLEDTVDEADAAAEDVVEAVADEAGDMADGLEVAAEDVVDEAADGAGDMADSVEEAVEETVDEAGDE